MRSARTPEPVLRTVSEANHTGMAISEGSDCGRRAGSAPPIQCACSCDRTPRAFKYARTPPSKGHSHPAKKYICPVFMFGHRSGEWVPEVLIAWNEQDRRSDGEIVENFHSHFVVN